MRTHVKVEKHRLKLAKKKKPLFRYVGPYGKIWDSRKPLVIRIIRLLWAALLLVVMLGAIAGIAIKYYQIVFQR